MVLEKAMYIQLHEHIHKNIFAVHFGFRTKLKKNTIYKLTNEILKALNNKIMVGGIFCDLEKASDCVNHEVLLSKLESCSVKGKAK